MIPTLLPERRHDLLMAAGGGDRGGVVVVPLGRSQAGVAEDRHDDPSLLWGLEGDRGRGAVSEYMRVECYPERLFGRRADRLLGAGESQRADPAQPKGVGRPGVEEGRSVPINSFRYPVPFPVTMSTAKSLMLGA